MGPFLNETWLQGNGTKTIFAFIVPKFLGIYQNTSDEWYIKAGESPYRRQRGSENYCYVRRSVLLADSYQTTGDCMYWTAIEHRYIEILLNKKRHFVTRKSRSRCWSEKSGLLLLLHNHSMSPSRGDQSWTDALGTQPWQVSPLRIEVVVQQTALADPAQSLEVCLQRV